jgi:hypothetical protein
LFRGADVPGSMLAHFLNRLFIATEASGLLLFETLVVL